MPFQFQDMSFLMRIFPVSIFYIDRWYTYFLFSYSFSCNSWWIFAFCIFISSFWCDIFWEFFILMWHLNFFFVWIIKRFWEYKRITISTLTERYLFKIKSNIIWKTIKPTWPFSVRKNPKSVITLYLLYYYSLVKRI